MPTTSKPFTAFHEEQQGAIRYLQALRRHWLLISLLVLVAAGAASAYSILAPKRFEASADVLITPVSSDDDTYVGFSLLREGIEQARSVVTAARIIRSPEVSKAAKRRLGPGAGDASVKVEPLGQSNIVTIEGAAEDPVRAAAIANAYADAVIERRTAQFERELESRIDQLSDRLDSLARPEQDFEAVALQQRLAELSSLIGAPDPTLRILSRAVPPEAAAWPRPALSVGFAVLAALLLGGGLAVALELVNPRIGREEELLLGQRLPILARIPRLERSAIRRYLAHRGPLPGRSQKAYRVLRANLATAGPDMRQPKVILVTSASPGEGKTMTAVNLARTMAHAGSRVILIDGDLHRPLVGTVMGVNGLRDGLARVLAGEKPAGALVSAPGEAKLLRLLLASPEHAHLMHRFESPRFSEALESLKEQSDVVVIDSPPLTEVAEALALAERAEAVLIAVRLGRTRRDRLNELRNMLALRGIAPLGFVVTSRDRGKDDSDYYYPTPASSNGRRREEGRPEEASPRVVQRHP